MRSLDQTPDKPKSFGHKVSWFAVKVSDPARVLDALEFERGTPANWASGFAAAVRFPTALESDWVFVAPPISGWVLVVGSGLPYPGERVHEIGRKFDVLFSRLMMRFADVQFFGSHRVSSFVAWARAQDGEPKRVFAYADSGVLANVGEQTPEEAKLKFANLNDLSPSAATDRMVEIWDQQEAEADALVAQGLSLREAWARVEQGGGSFPDERDVVELAALWSIDPRQLSNQDYPLELGLAARLPKILIQ
jgi:hypothetical protein